MTEVIVSIVTVFGGGLAAYLGKVAWDRYQRKQAQNGKAEAQKTSFRLTSRLIERINQQRRDWRASRLYVSLLHNSTNYGLPGLHFEKLTVAFESVDHLTQPAYGVIKGYPVLQFAPLIESLHEDGKHHRTYHDEPEGSESRAYMELNAIHDEFMVPIKDGRGVIVGIVGATYHGSRADWGASHWDTLTELAEQVSVSLTEVGEAGGSGVMEWGD